MVNLHGNEMIENERFNYWFMATKAGTCPHFGRIVITRWFIPVLLNRPTACLNNNDSLRS